MATESITGTRGLSVQERRQRNREEMRAGILAVAREIMREQGVGALNLNEIARRIGITPPALYTYFPSKMALYDALYRLGFRLFMEPEAELWRTTAPDWGRIQAWFALRLALAEEHPDLYHLVFDVPIPGFEPTPESLEEVRRFYDATVSRHRRGDRGGGDASGTAAGAGDRPPAQHAPRHRRVPPRQAGDGCRRRGAHRAVGGGAPGRLGTGGRQVWAGLSRRARTRRRGDRIGKERASCTPLNASTPARRP